MDAEENNTATVETTSQNQIDESSTDAATANTAAAGAKAARPRGRHAKDPLGQSICFKCQRVEDMETTLREYLENPTGDAEHTTLEFSFPVTAAFMVPKRELIGPQNSDKRTPYVYSVFNKTAVSVIDALHTIKDPKEQALTQKSISKTLVESVQRADGYKYSFHNHWLSREDQASRFSYYCNDSMLNKGRAANEGAAKVRNSVKIRKPVYECEGLLSVKFSVTKMSLELHYKHVPLHPTYEERAPPPRRDSKRRKLLEIFHPELLPTLGRQKRFKRNSDSIPKGKPTRKRRATKPLPQAGTDVVPDSGRENSLQPLFDFLGSAEGLQQDSSEAVVADQPEGGTVMDSTLVSGTDAVADTENPTDESLEKDPPSPPRFPGMMSGFMSGDNITWGPRPNVKKLRQKERQKERATRPSAPAPSAPSASANEQTPILSPNTTAPNSTSEIDALRAQLQAAEQKIRDMEAEKTRTNPHIGWNPPPQPQPGYPHGYYPPPPPQHYPYAPPPPHWPYPAPGPHGPSPHIYPPGPQPHGPQVPTAQSAPTYGFIGSPAAPPNAQPVNVAPQNTQPLNASSPNNQISASVTSTPTPENTNPQPASTAQVHQTRQNPGPKPHFKPYRPVYQLSVPKFKPPVEAEAAARESAGSD